MAIARTRTLLSLDQWAEIMNIDPVHFNQIVIGDPTGIADNDLDPATLCSDPVLQFSWQHANQLGREEIARAIKTAEDNIMRYTGFALAPTWTWNERIETVRPASPELFNSWGRTPRGQYQTVRTKWGLIQACGIETKTPLALSTGITYSDTDGDGYFETATLSVPVGSITDPREIALYYPGKNADEAYEVRPINVTINFTTQMATITCKRAQLVVESLMTSFQPQAVQGLIPVPPALDTSFLQIADVYRHWTDPSNQVTLQWDSPYCGSCGGTGGGIGCPACVGGVGFGCLSIWDQRLGFVSFQPGSWDGTQWGAGSWPGGRMPDHLLVNYKHGWTPTRPTDASGQLQNRMDDEWALAVAYYTCAILDRPICSCQGMQQLFRHWQDDLAMNISNSGGETTTRLGSKRVQECPFGSTRGALYAWDQVQRLKIGEGVSL